MGTHLRGAAIGLCGLLLAPGAATGVSDADQALPALPEPTGRTVPARFAVAGPLSPSDRQIVMITPDRSCGVQARDDQPWSATHVAESDTDVVVRIDVTALAYGAKCTSDQQIRVPIDLQAPLGERTIHDAGSDPVRSPLINRIDGIDTGFQYSCGGGPSSIVDLLGPGIDISDRGVFSSMSDARAITDTGDTISFLRPLRKNGRTDWESWYLTRGGAWQRDGNGTCLPLVVLSPGLHGATWSLRGPMPGPRSRRLRIDVQGWPCHGSPPFGQITRPIFQVRDESIVIIMGTFFVPNQLPDGLSARSHGQFEFIDCNGYGAVPMTIRLPGRLGNRKLYDGGVFPPQRRDRRR